METTTPAPKNNTLKILAGVAVGVVAFVAAQQLLFKAPSFDKQLTAAASELNKTCPLMVDKETRLDNTVALPGKVFQYNYTLINTLKDSIDAQKVQEYLKPVILNTIKTNPALQSFRDADVTMTYDYKDKNSAHLFTLTFAPSQYK